ncbi:bifunctional diaminohydroxyphosphoribosylaminopyrimidine deaminase/5-amino-6-(5-phosphoribosylamino)uracil reductase RibD [Sphingomonas sp. NCPPB 2930]
MGFDGTAQALGLAGANLFAASSRARSGCVLKAADGTVLATGTTGGAGALSAELEALRNVVEQGGSTSGATAYLVVEPDNSAACDALIAAGIARAVVSVAHPGPDWAGQGIARLRAAGIVVEVGPGASQARELNLGLFSRLQRQRPWVRLKAAISLDGATALPDGRSQWITAAAARTDGHAWRARACAVLTGMGTVRDDNPRLDVRLVPTPRQPPLVIVDSRLETPLNAALFEVPERAVWIYAAHADPSRQAALEQRGATVTLLPQPNGKVALPALMQDLARRGINELHVEAGAQLNGSLVREGLVDEFLVYMAPKLIGEGRPLAAFGPLADLGEALALRFQSVEQVGDDLRILARVVGRDDF